jgi:dethiobiotin synthetase
MKPVAAGVVRAGDGWASEDALALRAVSTVQVPPELDNPVVLLDPLSPHIAAARAGVRIDIAELVRRYHALALLADAVVVEGAGGFHVPLSATETGADLAQALALPVVLVVGLRLGCLNHAVLTVEAMRARGLALAGWVANRIDRAMQAQDDNITWLRGRLGAPLLADIPHQATPDPRAIAINIPSPP